MGKKKFSVIVVYIGDTKMGNIEFLTMASLY